MKKLTSKKGRKITLVLVILILSLGIITLLSQFLASTPKIVDNKGNVIEGSISILEKVNLGNTKQWVTIRGKAQSKPVLLFLAGGPGGSQLVETRKYLTPLEDHFVVVNWDQAGSGKSFSAVSKENLTPERYIQHAHELTLYLKKRFQKDKIFLLGQSWGTALGIWLSEHYPEDYYAFIGSGQMVSFVDTEKICYEKSLAIAKEQGDDKKIKELEEQGPPPYYGKDVVWKESNYLMYLSKYMSNNPNIHGPGYNTIGDVMSREYGIIDKINYFRGVLKTFNNVYQQLYGFDLRKQNTAIDIPVYFMHGTYDLNAPTSLVKDYYELLKAPRKELIWFEHSGHSPWISENALFVKKLLDIRDEVIRMY